MSTQEALLVDVRVTTRG